MNRTMWARSPASAQRNPTRSCFTHSLLTALIVFPSAYFNSLLPLFSGSAQDEVPLFKAVVDSFQNSF